MNIKGSQFLAEIWTRHFWAYSNYSFNRNRTTWRHTCQNTTGVFRQVLRASLEVASGCPPCGPSARMSALRPYPSKHKAPIHTLAIHSSVQRPDRPDHSHSPGPVTPRSVCVRTVCRAGRSHSHPLPPIAAAGHPSDHSPWVSWLLFFCK